MNWQTVFQCVQKIASMKPDAQHAMVQLRGEVVASTQLSAADKTEIHDLLDGLQSANLYGKISFVGKLKDALSKHPEFKAMYVEFGMPRS